MRGRWKQWIGIFGAMAWLGQFALAEAPQKKAKPERTYDARIEMHETPINAFVPSSLSLQDVLSESKVPSFESTIPHSPVIQSPLQPPRIKQPKPRNWILPPAIDESGAGEDGVSKRRRMDILQDDRSGEERTSGWGWLADEVLTRGRAKSESDGEDSEKENEAGQSEEEALFGSTMAEDGAGGLMNRSMTAPRILEPAPTLDVMGMVTIDEKNGLQDRTAPTRVSGGRSGVSRPSATKLEAPAGEMRIDFGSAQTGASALPGQDRSEPSAVLPRTTALLVPPTLKEAPRLGMSAPLSNLKAPAAPSLPGAGMPAPDRTPLISAPSLPNYTEGVMPTMPARSVTDRGFGVPHRPDAFSPTAISKPIEPFRIADDPWKSLGSR